ncbi:MULTISPECIES: hypothetical protein [Streptomyces]|uniref:Uncharacterized protein n=1 Tax=Streptomyces tsukubensis (strain DSM 42081 / NBRC 108919 / NRRL 18488 / 9993) TaxID=1114943 RepID=I2N668_STRT9|nr:MULTISPECIES: hypothetical protein [Streptomyces]AZK96488.1 hypothetical protein B7R87_23425 [Streptomyces tsukubensis]EIF92515.1 hypothetical protein [Streptomyces tsukubensis NRRL18488]MYS64754.1 hypothetical protein [Streptomyces sp. SID5473]QKM67508.1 hypothetical protein STSU_010355 [Streptomyces tsukubensis NRRL18488]TAI43903.1 hypothetical protein EWI31_10165 [Streptomyces tsukubensis]
MTFTQHKKAPKNLRRPAAGRPEATVPPRRRRNPRPVPKPVPQPADGRLGPVWKPVRPRAQRIYEAELLAELD